MTRIVRTAFILAFTAIAMLMVGPDLMLPLHPFSSFGLDVDPHGTIKSVDRVAEAAGLHVGDRVELKRLQPLERARYMGVVPEGLVVRLPLASGRTVTLHAHTHRRSTLDNVTDVIAVLALLTFIALAAALVLLRPMPATWAFYGFAYSFCSYGALVKEVSPQLLVGIMILMALAGAISPAAFVSFSLRFPDVKLKPITLWAERVLLFAVTPAIAAWGIYQLLAYIIAGAPAPAWIRPGNLHNALTDAIYAAGVAILIVRYATADSANRNRLRWVVAAFTVAFLPFLAVQFVWSATSVFPGVATMNLAQACEVFAPIALAYTVLKHRLFDVRFIVSRALMYAGMMSLSIGVLALIDWGFGRWISASRFTLFAELALALVLGAGLSMAQRRIEAFLNSVVFRTQTLALQALRRFALETDLISDPQRLLSQTHEALDARLESEYVAIYTADSSSYVRATPGTDSSPALLAADDFAVLRLRRWHEAFECDEPRHAFRGALLSPMTARGHLIGFIACGPKHDRTHYLPGEVETLTTLTHRVGSALALLTLPSQEGERFDNLRGASLERLER
jgi:hypothetical protein